MKNIDIIRTEIIDNTHEDENSNVQISEISVLVEFCYNNKRYCLDYQTTLNDSYEYSAELESYDQIPDHRKLAETFEDEDEDEEDFLNLLKEIKIKSDAEKLREEYVDENFIVSGKENSAKRR